MFPILKKRKLAENIYMVDVEAKRVARRCQPGEFIIVKTDREGERIPLTIVDYDRERGSVSIVYQVAGEATRIMETFEEGDSYMDFVGPLGRASEMIKEDPEELAKKRILFVAGGVGAAPVYLQSEFMFQKCVFSS